MAKFRFEGHEGTWEGDTPEEAWANLQAAQSEPTFGESAARGVGLATRATVFAPARTAASLGDIVASGLNFIGRFANRPPGIDAPEIFPTNNREFIESKLNEFLPEPQGLLERAVDLGGEAATTGGAAGAGLAARGQQVRAVPSLADDVAATFSSRPVVAPTSEFTAGAGASAAMDVADELDAGPLGQLASMLIGGVAGGAAPHLLATRGSQVANISRKVVEPLTGNVDAPTVEGRIAGGAGRRAAVELKRRADDPVEAAELARNAPEGVTPARATGDPELMALESRVLADDRQLADQVQSSLEGAEAQAVRDLETGLPEGVTRQQWQQQVIQRAAPDGVTIEAGDPDVMLRAARDGFSEAYSVARGHRLRNVEFTPGQKGTRIPQAIEEAVYDAEILTDNKIRDRVFTWVKGRYESVLGRDSTTKVSGSTDDPLVNLNSDDLLELRSVIRDKQRMRQKAGQTNPDAAAEAEILDNVDSRITSVLESQLPPEVTAQLRATDARYVDFKTVENAVLRSGEKGLTPEFLRTAIRSRNSQGRVARGETGDLGELAERGKDITSLLGKAGRTDDQISRAFRTMDEPQARAARADITRELMRKASPADTATGQPRLSGKGLQNQIETNASALRAAGFTNSDIGRMQQVARRLVTIQRPNVTASTQLIDDTLGALTRLVSGAAAAKATQRATQALGTGGTGSLMFGGAVRRTIQDTVRNMSVDGAERLLTDAVTDPELFAALLTRPTAPAIKQVQSARIINAWLAQYEQVE